jgi:hypothetical protein
MPKLDLFEELAVTMKGNGHQILIRHKIVDQTKFKDMR